MNTSNMRFSLTFLKFCFRIPLHTSIWRNTLVSLALCSAFQLKPHVPALRSRLLRSTCVPRAELVSPTLRLLLAYVHPPHPSKNRVSFLISFRGSGGCTQAFVHRQVILQVILKHCVLSSECHISSHTSCCKLYHFV